MWAYGTEYIFTERTFRRIAEIHHLRNTVFTQHRQRCSRLVWSACRKGCVEVLCKGCITHVREAHGLSECGGAEQELYNDVKKTARRAKKRGRTLGGIGKTLATHK